MSSVGRGGVREGVGVTRLALLEAAPKEGRSPRESSSSKSAHRTGNTRLDIIQVEEGRRREEGGSGLVGKVTIQLHSLTALWRRLLDGDGETSADSG